MPESDDDAFEVAEVKKQLEALKKELAAERQTRVKAETAEQEKKDLERLTATLEAAGLQGMSARIARSHLRMEGLVKRSGAGELVYIKRTSSGQEYELDLADGVAEWLKTAEGKDLLDSSDAREPGKGRRELASASNKPMTARQIATEALRRSGLLGIK